MNLNMNASIPRSATPEEIDQWFAATSGETLLECLADTISKWHLDDLDRLNLGLRLSPQQIHDLLKTTVSWGFPLLNRLVHWERTSVMKMLLDQTASVCQLTELLSLKGGRFKQNVLAMAVYLNQAGMVKYIYDNLSKDELYPLLLDGDFMGNAALHLASTSDYPLDELWEGLAFQDVSKLMAQQNKRGQTVLSVSIYWGSLKTFQSILKLYKTHQMALLDLVAISDSEGNTAFHYAAGQINTDFLIELVKSTIHPRNQSRFQDILQQENQSGRMFKPGVSWGSLEIPPHKLNPTIYKWSLNSALDCQYMMFDYPAVLIISNCHNRPGAKEEALALKECFDNLKFPVICKFNLKREQTFSEIENLLKSKRSQHGIIFALMSHGERGSVLDNDGVGIDITKIEELICPPSHKDIPKVMILQCCQTGGNGKCMETLTTCRSQPPSNVSSAMENLGVDPVPCERSRPIIVQQSYCPLSPNLCVLMSTSPNRVSYRGWFVQALVESFEKQRPHDDISTVMRLVIQKIEFRQPEETPACKKQLPVLQSTMSRKYCMLQILPYVLRMTEQHDSPEGLSFMTSHPDTGVPDYLQ